MGCGRRDEACRYPGLGSAQARLLQFRAKKNRALPGFFEIRLESDERRITRAATDLSQFGKRKFLNFNDFNDAFHVAPTPDDVDPKTAAECCNLEREFPVEVSGRSFAVSTKG
jgi:hypothetical protein